ncbi:MAG: TonB family protein [Candidatus Sulfotelmatobacter sp.]
MSEVSGPVQIEERPTDVADLRLLVELPSRPRVFLSNLRDIFLAREAAPLLLRSAPAPFWPDVFVTRGVPWRRFFQSGACHALAFALVWLASGFRALQPQAAPRRAIHDEVISYTPEEYLPPLDTRQTDSAQPQKADPEYSPQPIISVPREADNRSQTIVTPPEIKLKRDVAMPNVVAWSEQPQLPIAPAPLVPASIVSRLAPAVDNHVVAPAPDLASAESHRAVPGMQTSVIAPPPDVQLSAQKLLATQQAAVIAPPPAVEAASGRRLGDINIARSAVIAPAPRLTLDAQRAVAGRGAATLSASPQVVAPPPALRTSSSGQGGGRMIALNLHPAVGAPPDPPAGNRRGNFATTPEGRRGASGTPGSATGKSANSDGHDGAKGKEKGLPSGLYVGKTSIAAATSPVAGDPAGKPANTVNPNLMAGARPPHISSAPSRTLQPETDTKISEEEREVFRDRKFYSLTLNMPNLNSAGGSWIIRFAELKQNTAAADLPGQPQGSTASDLSAPSATRKVDPAYPLELMRQRLEGTVILFAVIHADGTVGGVRVLRSVDDRLDQYAREALSQWQFHPATKSGAPVDVEATFQIPFRPGRTQSSF